MSDFDLDAVLSGHTPSKPDPLDLSDVPPEDPKDPDTTLLEKSTGPARHFAQLVLADIPEDTLEEEDTARLARLLYAGSYIAFWQYLAQFTTKLDFAKQDKIIQRALAYIKHVESLQLAPLRLQEQEITSDDGLAATYAKIRARILEATLSLRQADPTTRTAQNKPPAEPTDLLPDPEEPNHPRRR